MGVIKEERKRSRTTETMSWPSLEEPAARMIMEQKDVAKRYAERWMEEEHTNFHTWWTDGS
jgi:hypothetical protein